MTVKVRKVQFESHRLPTQVRLLIADAATKAESKVWITAQFQLGAQSTDRLPVLVLEALDELQKLVDQGRADASTAPGAPTR